MLTVHLTLYRFICEMDVFAGLFSEDEEGRRIPDVASFSCSWATVPCACQNRFNPADVRTPGGVTSSVYFKPHRDNMALTFAYSTSLEMDADGSVLSLQLRPSQYEGGDLPVVANAVLDVFGYYGKPKKNYAIKLRDASSQIIGKLLFALYVETGEEEAPTTADIQQERSDTLQDRRRATDTEEGNAVANHQLASPPPPVRAPSPDAKVTPQSPSAARRASTSPEPGAGHSPFRTAGDGARRSADDGSGCPSFRTTPAPSMGASIELRVGAPADVPRPLPRRPAAAANTTCGTSKSPQPASDASSTTAGSGSTASPSGAPPQTNPRSRGEAEAAPTAQSSLDGTQVYASANETTTMTTTTTHDQRPATARAPVAATGSPSTDTLEVVVEKISLVNVPGRPVSHHSTTTSTFPVGQFVVKVRLGDDCFTAPVVRSKAANPEVQFLTSTADVPAVTMRVPVRDWAADRLRFSVFQDARQVAGFSLELRKFTLQGAAWKAFTIPFRYRAQDVLAALNLSVRRVSNDAEAQAVDAEEQELSNLFTARQLEHQRQQEKKRRSLLPRRGADVPAGAAVNSTLRTRDPSSGAANNDSTTAARAAPPNSLLSPKRDGDNGANTAQRPHDSLQRVPEEQPRKGTLTETAEDKPNDRVTNGHKPQPQETPENASTTRRTPLRGRDPVRRVPSPSPLHAAAPPPRQQPSRDSGSRMNTPRRCSMPNASPRRETPPHLTEHDRYLSGVLERLQQRQQAQYRRSLHDEWAAWRDNPERSRNASRDSSVDSRRSDSVASVVSRRASTPRPTKSLRSFLSPGSPGV